MLCESFDRKKIYDTTAHFKRQAYCVTLGVEKKQKHTSPLQILITSSLIFNSDLCKAILCTNLSLIKLSQPIKIHQ